MRGQALCAFVGDNASEACIILCVSQIDPQLHCSCVPLALCSEIVTDAELEAAARIEVRSTHPHELAAWAGAGMAVLCRRLLVITPSTETFAASVKRAADAVAENIPVASSMWAGLTSKLHELPAPSAAPYALQVRSLGAEANRMP